MAASINLSGKYTIHITDRNGQHVDSFVEKNAVLYTGLAQRHTGLATVELALGEDNTPTDIKTHTSVLVPLKYNVTASKDNAPSYTVGRALDIIGSTTFDVDVFDDCELGEVAIVGFSRTAFPTKRFIEAGSKLEVTYDFTLSYEVADTPFDYKGESYTVEAEYRVNEELYKDYKWYSLLKDYGYFKLTGLSQPVTSMENISRSEPYAQKDVAIYDTFYLATNVEFTSDERVTFSGFETGTPAFGTITRPYNLLTEDGDVIPLNLPLENSQRIGVVEYLSTALGE